MAYSESLAQRVRSSFAGRRGIIEKKMFGGVGFLLNGNMCVGIWKDSLIARIGESEYAEALQQPNVREFDITGRAMAGWVLIEPDGIESDKQLSYWTTLSCEFVTTLAVKEAKPSKKKAVRKLPRNSNR